jgi:hypothetical protein
MNTEGLSRFLKTDRRPHNSIYNWEPIGCLETSVNNHQSRPHKIPEEQLSILYIVNVFRGRVYSTLGIAKKQI